MELGAWGESFVARYLQGHKARILYKNYFIRPFGEIDIVAKAYDGTLLFVEVKTMVRLPSEVGLVPEDQVGAAKLGKLMKMGEMFSAKHPELVSDPRGWRIDLAAVSVPNRSLTYQSKDVIINYYENIVPG